MDFIKTHGVNHYIQRLYVHWDITTMCEYKCSYCYARKQYKNKWGVPAIWSKQQHVLNELSKSTLPIFLGLLGGEPTSHQRYFTLLDLIQERILINKDSRLYITTNGAKDLNFYDKHKDVDGGIYMLWSLHPEYVDDDKFESFYNNVVLMYNKGYKTKINVMLHPNKKYWNSTKERYKRLDELGYSILHPHFIYGGFNEDVSYTSDFYDYFSFLENQRVKEFVFSTEKEDFIFSDYEIFSNNFNQFKGWKCWHNNFEIRSNCLISDQCFNRQPHEIPIDYFKNITEIQPRICPHMYCSCDGLMKIYKEKI